MLSAHSSSLRDVNGSPASTIAYTDNLCCLGTIGLFNDKLEALTRRFGLAYDKRLKSPVVPLSDKATGLPYLSGEIS